MAWYFWVLIVIGIIVAAYCLYKALVWADIIPTFLIIDVIEDFSVSTCESIGDSCSDGFDSGGD